MSGRSSAKVPGRVAWAVELLDVAPDDRILEFGCGGGVAVSLIGDRLSGGQVTAIDRSATAIERTRRRNAEHLAAGRAMVHRADLAGFDAPPAWFDKAVGINVNLFWTTDAETECRLLARVLRPAGTLHLVYEGPPSGGTPDVGPDIAGTLGRHGFAAHVTVHPTDPMVAVTARRRSESSR
jgi:SAM-dependent methyltransferase